jgi:hypothetical protein
VVEIVYAGVVLFRTSCVINSFVPCLIQMFYLNFIEMNQDGIAVGNYSETSLA